MPQAKQLTMGVDSASPTPQEQKERLEVLRATVEKYLPEFAKGVAEAASRAREEGGVTMVLHQDAFAAGLDDDEYTLLGMAVKYAGLYGVAISVIGTNHETF